MNYARWHLTWASNTKLQGRIRTLSKKCVTIGRFEFHCPCRAQAQISMKIEAEILKFGLPASSRQLQDSSFKFQGQLPRLFFKFRAKYIEFRSPGRKFSGSCSEALGWFISSIFVNSGALGRHRNSINQYFCTPGALGFTPGAPKSVQISIGMTPGALRITPGAPESPPRPPESVQISISLPLGLWKHTFH